jgi:undecaprenyl-diphosphatase
MMQHKDGSKKVKRSNVKELFHSERKLLFVCLVFLIGFASVLLFRHSFATIDSSINLWIPSIQSGYFTVVAKAISFVFDTYSLLVITLAISAFLLIRSYRGESLLLLGAMGGDTVLVAAIKSLVHSPRPLNGLVANSGFSFPSGHTVSSIVFFWLACFLASRFSRKSPNGHILNLQMPIF